MPKVRKIKTCSEHEYSCKRKLSNELTVIDMLSIQNKLVTILKQGRKNGYIQYRKTQLCYFLYKYVGRLTDVPLSEFSG